MLIDLLVRMRREVAVDEAMLAASLNDVEPDIDALIVIDRAVDLVTPLATQLTFEGMLDEFYGIKNCMSHFLFSLPMLNLPFTPSMDGGGLAGGWVDSID